MTSTGSSPKSLRPHRKEGGTSHVCRATVLTLAAITLTGCGFTPLYGAPGVSAGLSEFEVWGEGSQSLDPAPTPPGNLAFNPGDRPFPRATASFTSRFDRVERVNDGVINFTPNPNNR